MIATVIFLEFSPSQPLFGCFLPNFLLLLHLQQHVFSSLLNYFSSKMMQVVEFLWWLYKCKHFSDIKVQPPEDKPSNCPKQFFNLTKRIQSLPFKYSKMFAFRLLISALLVSTALSAILSNGWLSQYPIGKDSSYYYPSTGYVSYSTGSKPDGFYLICGDCGIFGKK